VVSGQGVAALMDLLIAALVAGSALGAVRALLHPGGR
jgi:hypothetical protein